MFLDMINETFYNDSLNEEFSQEMKNSVSSKILNKIGEFLHSYNISAQNVTFKKVPKDQQAKLKRRVKEFTSLGRFVFLIHKQDLQAVKEIKSLASKAKKEVLDINAKVGDQTLRQKLNDLQNKASVICYMIDTGNSDCKYIKENFRPEWKYIDKDNYNSYITTLSKVKDEVTTGKFEGYVSQIQDNMRDLEFDAYIIEAGEADPYINDTITARRNSRKIDDPLDPDLNWNGKNQLRIDREEKAKKMGNRKTFDSDVELVRDKIDSLKRAKSILHKAVDQIVSAFEDGKRGDVYKLLDKVDANIVEMRRCVDLVRNLEKYTDSHYQENFNLHDMIKNTLNAKMSKYY